MSDIEADLLIANTLIKHLETEIKRLREMLKKLENEVGGSK